MGEILKSNFWELLQLVNTAEKGKKGKDLRRGKGEG